MAGTQALAPVPSSNNSPSALFLNCWHPPNFQHEHPLEPYLGNLEAKFSLEIPRAEMPMHGADRKGWVEIAYSQSSRWQAQGEAGMPASSVSCPFRDTVSGVDSQGLAAKSISDPEEKKEVSTHPRNTSGPRPFSDKLLRGISVLVVTIFMLLFVTN